MIFIDGHNQIPEDLLVGEHPCSKQTVGERSKSKGINCCLVDYFRVLGWSSVMVSDKELLCEKLEDQTGESNWEQDWKGWPKEESNEHYVQDVCILPVDRVFRALIDALEAQDGL